MPDEDKGDGDESVAVELLADELADDLSEDDAPTESPAPVPKRFRIRKS